jgi:hypothetical protein
VISYDGQHDPNNAYCGISGSAPVNQPCLLWQANYGNFRAAYGCDLSKTKPEWQQTENMCYWYQHGLVSAARGC